jgi:microcin C transport system substrate-binding protein
MTVPPRTDGDSSLRANLRRAQQLLKEAGWEVRDGALRNAKGQAMVLEYMDSNEGGVRTVVTPWMRSLEKLGITLRFRSVDFALYQQRLQKFDFDITSMASRARTTRARSLPTCLAARPRTPRTRAILPA